MIKPTTFANSVEGFAVLFERLERLGIPPEQVLIGLEATSRYGENLSRALFSRGYHHKRGLKEKRGRTSQTVLRCEKGEGERNPINFLSRSTVKQEPS
jgi:transposase